MSICMDCKKGADECGWMRALVPVPGWTAKPVRLEKGHTYDVLACPDFVGNVRKKKEYKTRLCKRCGRQFIPRGARQIYCGEFCMRMAKRLV